MIQTQHFAFRNKDKQWKRYYEFLVQFQEVSFVLIGLYSQSFFFKNWLELSFCHGSVAFHNTTRRLQSSRKGTHERCEVYVEVETKY